MGEIKPNSWGIPPLFIICALSPGDPGSRTTDNSAPASPQLIRKLTPALSAAGGGFCWCCWAQSVQLCLITHPVFVSGLQFLIMEWGEGGSHGPWVEEPHRTESDYVDQVSLYSHRPDAAPPPTQFTHGFVWSRQQHGGVRSAHPVTVFNVSYIPARKSEGIFRSATQDGCPVRQLWTVLCISLHR